ncbi:MAG TPA: ATP-binding protein [Acidimicrobiales bacterium]|nr:ATP-binding protein [Acidimicrobiales bacterium]
MTRRTRTGVVTLTLTLLTAALVPAVIRGGDLPFEAYRELGVGVLFVVAGFLGWVRRPASAVGKLLTVAGLIWLSARALVWAGTNPVVFTVGLVLVLLPIAFLAHLAVGFPSGRVAVPFERFVVVTSYLVIISGVAFLDLSGCADCPVNLLAIEADEGVGRWLRALVLAATLGAIGAFSAVLVSHWRRGSRAARRVLAPVLPTALLYAAVSAANILSELGAPVGLGRQWAWVEDVAILAVPIAFLGGLLRSRLARYGVGELVVELGTAAGGELRSALSRALGDPSVDIAYWKADREGYVDADGRRLELPSDDPDRAVTVITRADERIGALVHDPALREEPGLLDAVCAAAGLAMENERLHAEVLARLAEVSASRARIVEAADAERRRVERNLHDGAQQRLVTLSMVLTMARSRWAHEPSPSGSRHSDVGELLSEAAGELVLALRELRELARGIHPAILTEEGLDAALQSLAERSPVPVELSAQAGAPLPQPVEATAYYVVSEALANVAKYADASRVKVTVGRCERGLRVEVTDDGVGGAAARRGSGLEGLADRVAALEGRLVVNSPVGQGTRVTAELPCG